MSLESKRIPSCDCLNCKVIRINCRRLQQNQEDKLLREKIKELATKIEKLKSNWCSTIRCKIKTENRELKEEIEKLLVFYRYC